jgi:transcriptional regulator with XRE-family HTH domain
LFVLNAIFARFFCAYRFVWFARRAENGGMKIGKVLRQHRSSQGKTLEAVSFVAGTDAGNLSRIERDEQRPSLDLLEEIARALGLTVSAIYAEVENQASSVKEPGDRYRSDKRQAAEMEKQVNQLTRYFCALSPEGRELALNIVQTLKKAHPARDNPS